MLVGVVGLGVVRAYSEPGVVGVVVVGVAIIIIRPV